MKPDCKQHRSSRHPGQETESGGLSRLKAMVVSLDRLRLMWSLGAIRPRVRHCRGRPGFRGLSGPGSKVAGGGARTSRCGCPPSIRAIAVTMAVLVFNGRENSSRHFGRLRLTLRVLYHLDPIDSNDVLPLERPVTVVFDTRCLIAWQNNPNQRRCCLLIDIIPPNPVSRHSALSSWRRHPGSR